MKDVEILKNRRILLIDDNRAIHEDFRKILHLDSSSADAARQLDELEGALFGESDSTKKKIPQVFFEMESAFQGQEGFAMIQQANEKKTPYAMAFVDVRMPPGWDGIETITKIWEVDPDLQVVICTAYSDYSWDDMISKLGYSDHLLILKKPFDNVEVLQLAHALTDKWHLVQLSKQELRKMESVVEEQKDALRDNEEHFRIIAENVADLIAIVDENGKRLFNSPSYERVLGYSPKELKEGNAFEQIHPEDRQRIVVATQQAIGTGKGELMEYRMQHRNGSWHVLESYANIVSNPHGSGWHLVIVSRDVTERKKEEQERSRMEVELRQGQKMQSLGQLAAGIAHEINTPTQYIGDNVEFLKTAFQDFQKLLEKQEGLWRSKAEALEAQVKSQWDEASKSADVEYLLREVPRAIQQSLDGLSRVSKIVRAMKAFSHPGTGEKSQLDVNHSIENTLIVASSEWKYVAEVVSEYDPQLPSLFGFPGEFNQLILNLVVNAAHAIGDVVGTSGQKGTIKIATSHDKNFIEIRVSDTGTGIPAEVRGKIFDPFFTTKEVGKGTGQGLTFVHSVVVDMHGGTIHFETECGKGTTFIVRLPIGSKNQPQEEKSGSKGLPSQEGDKK
jgi:PAS domain S-box-containing protein